MRSEAGASFWRSAATPERAERRGLCGHRQACRRTSVEPRKNRRRSASPVPDRRNEIRSTSAGDACSHQRAPESSSEAVVVAVAGPVERRTACGPPRMGPCGAADGRAESRLGRTADCSGRGRAEKAICHASSLPGEPREPLRADVAEAAPDPGRRTRRRCRRPPLAPRSTAISPDVSRSRSRAPRPVLADLAAAIGGTWHFAEVAAPTDAASAWHPSSREPCATSADHRVSPPVSPR